MSGLDRERALAVACAAAQEAGALLSAEFHRPGGPRFTSDDHADIDEVAERLIRGRLLGAFPESSYIGEETGSQGDPARSTWYVDPNDGTRSYIKGLRGAAVSIALVEAGVPVLGVVFAPNAPDDGGDLLTWAEGGPVRRNGAPCVRAPLAAALQAGDVILSSQDCDKNAAANAKLCAPARYRAIPSIAYRLALVAAGEGEAGMSLNSPTHWDYAAGHALLRGAGAELFDERCAPVRYPGHARSAWIFGCTAGVARELAARPWDDVRVREPQPAGLAARWPLAQGTHALRCTDAGVLARAQGVLLGQVAGDALGQLVEFRSAAEIARQYPNGVRDLADGGSFDTIAGQPTDDSELALSLARSILLQGGFDQPEVERAYRAWLDSGPFDVGNTTRRGLTDRPDGASQANGALMRVSPLALWAWRLTPEQTARHAREDAALTHPHPVCADASAAFCVAIAHAVQRGGSGRDAWEAALSWTREVRAEPAVVTALLQAVKGPPSDYQRHMGWVLIALQNAFYQLLHAPSLEAGVIDTVGRGGDTDTNGAIAGALLGAVHGRDAVPLRWRRAVLSCRSIGKTHPRPRTFWPVDVLDVAEQLLAHGPRG